MAKVFNKLKINPAEVTLSKEAFKLFLDMENPTVSEEKMGYVIKRAEEYLKKPIPSLPLSLYREFQLNGNRTNYEDRYFERREMLVYLSLAESYERCGRFTDMLCDLIWAICDETSWLIPAHASLAPALGDLGGVPYTYNDEYMHGIDLFAAGTSAILTNALYFCRDIIDGVNPIITERIEYEIEKRIFKPFYNCVFHWSGARGNKVNNWCPWVVSNVLYTVALLEDSTKMRALALGKCISYLDNFIGGYNEDGGCDEGPTYWNVAGAALFDALEIVYDMSGGAVNVFEEPIIKAIGEYEAKFNIDEDRYINFADAGGRCRPDGYLMARYGRRCGSSMLEAFGKVTSGKNSYAISLNNGYRTVKNLMTPPYPAQEKTKAEKFVYFPNLKVMISREDEDTSRGLFLAMKSGHNGESHNHNDVGNFIVYCNGNPVIIDVGVGAYTKQTFSPDRYKLWFMQSGYHNLPSFDGVDQRNGADFSAREEVYCENDGSFLAEIGGAYPKEAGVLSYKRHSLLEGNRVIVTDTVSLSEEKEIDFHFMSPVKPTLISDGDVLLAEGCHLRFDTALCVEIEEFFSEGLDAKRAWGSENLWRIHLKTRAKDIKTVFTFTR